SARVLADEFQGGARGVPHRGRAGRDQGRVRPQRGGHAPAHVPAAGGSGRAVCLHDLRLVGSPRQSRSRLQAADPAVRSGAVGMMRFYGHFIATIALLLGCGLARAASPALAAVMPRGAQRGTDLEITLAGDRLADAQDVLFYQPGLTVKKLVATTQQVKAQ